MPVRVPIFAKQSAIKGLRLRGEFEGDKPGLSPKEAREEGVRSGVTTARTLINNNVISDNLAKAIGRFWLRFRNCRTKKCEIALLLWGGRRFGQEMARRFF